MGTVFPFPSPVLGFPDNKPLFSSGLQGSRPSRLTSSVAVQALKESCRPQGSSQTFASSSPDRHHPPVSLSHLTLPSGKRTSTAGARSLYPSPPRCPRPQRTPVRSRLASARLARGSLLLAQDGGHRRGPRPAMTFWLVVSHVTPSPSRSLRGDFSLPSTLSTFCLHRWSVRWPTGIREVDTQMSIYGCRSFHSLIISHASCSKIYTTSTPAHTSNF